MVANILPADRPTPYPWGWGEKVNFQLFSERGQIAYQIKGNHECSNMVAFFLPAYTPPPFDPRDGVNRSKVNFFRTWSCCISN